MGSTTLNAPRASVEAVTWAAGMGAVTPEALAARADISREAARRRLASAEKAGLLAVERPLLGRPSLYRVTARGLSATGNRRLGGCRVSAANAEHLAQSALVAAVLARRHPDHRVLGERELRHEEHEAGRPLASAQLAGARLASGLNDGKLLHRPDLVLWPRSAAALPVAVEVELTVKSPRRLDAICRAWARCRLVAGVLYCATPAAHAAVSRAVARVQAHERIVVVALEEVLGPWA